MRQALRNRQINDETQSCVQSSHLYRTVLPARLQPQYPQSLRNDHPLLPVVWWRYTLIQLKAFQGSGSSCGFVGNHATNGTVKNLRGCSVVEGARLFWIHDVAFVEEVVVAELQKVTSIMYSVAKSSNLGSSGMYLVAEEAARDINLFAPDNDNFLSAENLFGDYGGESTQEMALSIYYDGGRRNGGHDEV